jgi:uncharacterized protein YndB with AHSA1/START domain
MGMSDLYLAGDDALDLVFERIVPVTPDFLFDGWTRPERLVRWFTPAPWRTVSADVDLRPGGRFANVMQGPNGESVENEGCWLWVERPNRLIWTGALRPGFRPRSSAELAAAPFLMTAVLEFTAVATGTRYRATVMHGDSEARARHDAMHFQAGWGQALDQLVSLAGEFGGQSP